MDKTEWIYPCIELLFYDWALTCMLFFCGHTCTYCSIYEAENSRRKWGKWHIWTWRLIHLSTSCVALDITMFNCLLYVIWISHLYRRMSHCLYKIVRHVMTVANVTVIEANKFNVMIKYTRINNLQHSLSLFVDLFVVVILEIVFFITMHKTLRHQDSHFTSQWT
jgi:hypothetical protein